MDQSDQVRYMGAHPILWTFKPARVNSVTLAYDLRLLDGWPHSGKR